MIFLGGRHFSQCDIKAFAQAKIMDIEFGNRIIKGYSKGSGHKKILINRDMLRAVKEFL